MSQENKVQWNRLYDEKNKSNSLLKKFAPLKKNEVAEYRLVGTFDPNSPDKIFLKTMLIPSQDVLIDDDGETWPIGAIKGKDSSGDPLFYEDELWFKDTSGSYLRLNGSSAKDQVIYKYLELTNFNLSNPNRDTSRSALFERVDENKDIDQKRAKFKKTVTAMQMVEDMSDADILNFIRANALHDAGSDLKRRYFLEDLAQKNPDKFDNAVTTDFQSLKEPIELAKKKKIFQYNNLQRQWTTHDGKLVHTVKKGATSQVTELAKYLMSPEGKAHLEYMETELAK